MKDSSMQDWQQNANDTLNEIYYLEEELKHSIYEYDIEIYMFDIAEAKTYYNELIEAIEAHGGIFERNSD